MTPEKFDRSVITKLVQGDQVKLSLRQEQLVDDISEYFETVKQSYIREGMANAFSSISGFCQRNGGE